MLRNDINFGILDPTRSKNVEDEYFFVPSFVKIRFVGVSLPTFLLEQVTHAIKLRAL